MEQLKLALCRMKETQILLIDFLTELSDDREKTAENSLLWEEVVNVAATIQIGYKRILSIMETSKWQNNKNQS